MFQIARYTCISKCDWLIRTIQTSSSRQDTQATLQHASNQVKVWTRIPRYNIIREGSQRVYRCIFQIARYTCITNCDRLFRCIHTLSSRWDTQATLKHASNQVKVWISEPKYIHITGSRRGKFKIFQIARYTCIYKCERLFRSIHTLGSRQDTQAKLQTADKFRVSELSQICSRQSEREI